MASVGHHAAGHVGPYVNYITRGVVRVDIWRHASTPRRHAGRAQC
jgi:hypothetical protein